MCFIGDPKLEPMLRDGLADTAAAGFEVRRGGIAAAVAAMRKLATPRTLIVDISGEEQPLTALTDLSQVVEPDVSVLVIGEVKDLDFYRELTRGLGVQEYLCKPVTRDMVSRHFAPIVSGRVPQTEDATSGRLVTITGARGGVGASTVAANLAWHFGVMRNRHTLLLDPNLHTGTAALFVDSNTSPGLRAALEMPDRIDDLFVERAAQLLKERLFVLASQEGLTERPVLAEGAAARLLAVLRRRYNFTVADVPFQPVPLYRDLLDMAHRRVLVLEPTLAGVRDTLRLRALPASEKMQNPVTVLNRLGMPGGLTRQQIEDALEFRIDVVIPDLPKRLAEAANMGEPAASGRGFFRLRMHEIARLVAFNALLDSSAAPEKAKRQGDTRSWRSIFGRKK